MLLSCISCCCAGGWRTFGRLRFVRSCHIVPRLVEIVMCLLVQVVSFRCDNDDRLKVRVLNIFRSKLRQRKTWLMMIVFNRTRVWQSLLRVERNHTPICRLSLIVDRPLTRHITLKTVLLKDLLGITRLNCRAFTTCYILFGLTSFWQHIS